MKSLLFFPNFSFFFFFLWFHILLSSFLQFKSNFYFGSLSWRSFRFSVYWMAAFSQMKRYKSGEVALRSSSGDDVHVFMSLYIDTENTVSLTGCCYIYFYCVINRYWVKMLIIGSTSILSQSWYDIVYRPALVTIDMNVNANS